MTFVEICERAEMILLAAAGKDPELSMVPSLYGLVLIPALVKKEEEIKNVKTAEEAVQIVRKTMEEEGLKERFERGLNASREISSNSKD